ncbi:ABC transporter permease subunit [Nostoc sp. CHAB 5784]|uniref:ABC transporter permease subunit n=1 Tax=Nostoc mirabile TaxID=2907820 RepID=UPI001E61DE71|nr:ABC transporter permease subunit [Nostoc mirabile]MCC5664369.1 ABC transporter permease subunit [Nostoc mirabile CHAB5784]
MSKHPVITLNQISKVYTNGTVALQDLNLVIPESQFVSLVGPSGCGKSTVLRLIAGLGRTSSGSIDWGITQQTRKLAFVFQDAALMPWANVRENVRLPLKLARMSNIAAAISGLLMAILFTQSKWIERSLFPYAVILQTTSIVAIAPLIILWLKNNTFAALVVCAWIVAFFPIVSNTTLGLNSVDRNLLNLFQLYKASRWQTLLYLRLPSAMPYFLGGLKISGGLALIGAVVYY